jgi:CDP-paratose 2-epimerase
VKILITGICGFVGSTLATTLMQYHNGLELFGIDNFIRSGAQTNKEVLRQLGVRVFYGDIRCPSDLEALPPVDWVIDAAANPSVLAGIDGKTTSRQLVEHNLYGTINLLEYCKMHRAGFILLSTSRVYSIQLLASLPVVVEKDAYRPNPEVSLPSGLKPDGITETFSTDPPISLYGCTKLAGEALALEYGQAFSFPVWINRCGVLGGSGQFGYPNQGTFAYWINSYVRKRPLKYIGFGGHGYQVRDCLHPRDLVPLVQKQIAAGCESGRDRIINVSGGVASAISLRQLSSWCAEKFGSHEILPDPSPRPFDIPWMVLNSAKAAELWQWRPEVSLHSILDEIAEHAQKHPDWLQLSAPL